jgi:predicted transcriptional regulator
MLDTGQMDQVIAKLESLEDEELAVKLLKEFNDRTKALGELIMNKDEALDHEEWKQKCDEAKEKVDELLERIDRL